MGEELGQQKKANINLLEYIKKDKEIRELIMKKEMKKVSAMIKEYDAIPSLAETAGNPPSKKYSGAIVKMGLINSDLTNNIVNSAYF